MCVLHLRTLGAHREQLFPSKQCNVSDTQGTRLVLPEKMYFCF